MDQPEKNDSLVIRLSEAINRALSQELGTRKVEDAEIVKAIMTALAVLLGNLLFQLALTTKEHPLKIMTTLGAGITEAFLNYKKVYEEARRTIN